MMDGDTSNATVAKISAVQAVLALPVGGTVVASQRAGDFTLPADTSQKSVMIAGGIGVASFRSHIKYLMDTEAKTSTILFYMCTR